MAQTRCRKCLLNQDSGELYQSIQELIAALPEEEKAAEQEYRRRLALCEGCDKLQNGMCLSCGCFVQVRAAKKRESCPWERWKAASDSN